MFIIYTLYSTVKLLGGTMGSVVGKYLGRLQHNDLSNGLIYMISTESWTTENTEEYLEMIHQVPASVQIKLVISSVGGYYSPCFHLVRHLRQHPSGYIVYVYDQCLSAGTFMALGAKEIVMNPYSRLGKIDPVGMSTDDEVCRYAREFEKEVPTFKEYAEIRGHQDWVNYVEEELRKLFENDEKMYTVVRDKFIHSPLPHIKVFYYEECLKLGLRVRLPRGEEEKYFKWK